MFLRNQNGDAGLDGGLVEGLDGGEKHHHAPHRRHRVPPGEQQAVARRQGGGGEVQAPHDPLPGHPVGQHAPQGGAEEHRHHGQGQHPAEGGGGAGGVQHLEGEGEAEDGVAQEGDDLSDHHEGEVAGEQADWLHGKSSFLFNTDGWYVYCPEKPPSPGGR